MKIFNRTTLPKCVKIVTVAGISLLLTKNKAQAQADIHFSQFYETSILRNPALTGVFANDFKVGAYYRSQWSSISHPFQTFLASGEARVSLSKNSEDFFSFGILSYADRAGSVDQKINTFYPAVNYNKSINPEHNTYLSVGFTGGYMQYSFEPGKATFNNQYLNGQFDPHNPTMENITNATMSMWDLGAGVNYNTSSGENNNITYMVGVSGYHFTQPKFSYSPNVDLKQNMRWNANAAASFSASDNFVFQLQGNYARQGKFQEIMIGGMVNWIRLTKGTEPEFTISAGAFLRYNDAVIPVLKMKYKNVAVATSYDVNISTLKQASKMDGGYEITVFVSGNFSYKGIMKKTVCPKF
ncbi:MAG: PorP/SprF family type IX secretion system membrane protein [Bacteroidota bacterium]